MQGVFSSLNEWTDANDLTYIENSIKPCLEITYLKVNIKYSRGFWSFELGLQVVKVLPD